MKTIIFLCLLVVAVSASPLEKKEEQFEAFKLKHGKVYKNTAEETKRLDIFTQNLQAIEQHNALYKQGLVSYEQGVNKFTDMTQEEFSATLTLRKSDIPHFHGNKHVVTGLAVPEFIDWRTKGQVTEIKDQGDCGSCWTFAVTGSVEAAYARKSGKLVSLSEQQLIDCTTDFNFGCAGGYPSKSFTYISEYGIESEENYPYLAQNDSCKYSPENIVTKISNFTYIKTLDEDALLDAVANIGPVTVNIVAFNLYSYKTGVYIDIDRCDPNKINHGVIVVGYGSENGTDYWIVKNSWGTHYGEDGYFRLRRGTNEICVAEIMGYPTVD